MTRAGARAGQQGFTLLETVIVMAISALILTVVIAAKPRAAALRLSVEARAVVAALRAKHAAALTGAIETRFALDAANRTFYGPDKPEILPQDMEVEMLGARTADGTGLGEIRFYPDGRSSGGAIALSLEGARARIDVDWLTGDPWLH